MHAQQLRLFVILMSQIVESSYQFVCVTRSAISSTIPSYPVEAGSSYLTVNDPTASSPQLMHWYWVLVWYWFGIGSWQHAGRAQYMLPALLLLLPLHLLSSQSRDSPVEQEGHRPPQAILKLNPPHQLVSKLLLSMTLRHTYNSPLKRILLHKTH